MKKEYITNSAIETKKLGEKLAKEILSFNSVQDRQNKIAKTADKAFVLALKGDLGGGKTTFLQGLAQGLGIKEKILSPTFVLMKRFHVSCFMFHDFYHIDCYRIKGPKEVLELGFKEIISDPKNIVAIEWAEQIREVLPKDTLWLSFKATGIRKRLVFLK